MVEGATMEGCGIMCSSKPLSLNDPVKIHVAEKGRRTQPMVGGDETIKHQSVVGLQFVRIRPGIFSGTWMG